MSQLHTSQAITNKNVAFIDNPVCWVFYTLLVFIFRVIFSGLGLNSPVAWTLVNYVHGIISFFCFHWIKGSPFIEDHGEYHQLTFWEQIDDQVQYTRARKFLLILPCVLFVFACDAANWELAFVWMNLLRCGDVCVCCYE